MEAIRFGFDLDTPPAFKFDPTDDDLVAYYLLPRALGITDPPFAHAVIDDDPASLPPRDLLARHGHATSHQAFFLDKNGGRPRERAIKDGTGGLWRGQQSEHRTLTLLRPGGGEVDIKYKRYDLTYKEFDDDEEEKSKKRKRKHGGSPSGWVMQEYTIVSPPLQTTVLSRIHLTKGKIKEDQKQADADDQQSKGLAEFNQQQFLPPAEQSYNQDEFLQQEQPDPSCHHDFPHQVQEGPSHHQEFSYQELAGPSYYNHPLDMVCGGTGLSDGTQASGASCYGENFRYQEQQAGPSYQEASSYYHHPADGGEGFSDVSQANEASCYGENGGAMGDSYLNFLCDGEGFAGDNLYCGDGFYFSAGSHMEFSHGGTGHLSV